MAPTNRRTQYIAAGVVTAAAIFYVQDSRARWVHEFAVPNIQRLIEADKLDSAYALQTEAVSRAPNDSSLARYWLPISQVQSFISEPAGATVTRVALDDTTHWIPVARRQRERLASRTTRGSTATRRTGIARSP